MLSKKMQKIKASAVHTLAAKAKELKRQGKDVVNLAMGEPTWDCFDAVKKDAQSAIEKGCSGYAPAAGLLELKSAIVEEVNKHLNLSYELSQVTVSMGAKYVLFSALQALLDPEDEVLIPAPYWVSYPSMTALAGGRAVIVEGDTHTHKITPQSLKSSVTSKSKVLILNSPNNPAGVVYSLEELKKLGECLREQKQIYVLSDDIYNRMALEHSPSAYAPHILSVCPDLKDRVIVINSASKNYAMPGWRLGWAVGQQSIIKAMSAFQSQTVSGAATISQMAMASNFKNCEMEVQKIHALLLEKRKTIMNLFQDIKNIQFQKPQGAFYVWLDIRGVFGKKYKGKEISSSMDVFNILMNDQALFMVPGEEFGRAGYLRLYFAAADHDIEKCAQRIKNFISHLN